jgi:hypothetical protein
MTAEQSPLLLCDAETEQALGEKLSKSSPLAENCGEGVFVRLGLVFVDVAGDNARTAGLALEGKLHHNPCDQRQSCKESQ